MSVKDRDTQMRHIDELAPRQPAATPADGDHLRLAGLDTLRSLAILMVIARHAGEFLNLREPGHFTRYGWVGVDLFFVLSGFLIASQLLRTVAREGCVSYARFYLKRSFRILPAYYVVLGLYYLWPGFVEREPLDHWWRYAFFLMNFNWQAAAFSHAWSLCIEEHFYLAVPLLVAAYANRRPLVPPAFLLTLVFVGGVVLRYLCWNNGAHISRDIYRPTYCHVDGLAAGLMLALLRERRRAIWDGFVRHPWILLGVGLVLTAVGAEGYELKGQVTVAYSFLVLALGSSCCVMAALAPGFWLADWRFPGVRFVAVISYSLYLTHKQMIHLAMTLVQDPKQETWTVVLIAIPLIALAGCLLYFLVERPGLALRDRILAARLRLIGNQPWPALSSTRPGTTRA
jgi:peptidoglycan/LPS O-acetylase OafA/YrhL